MHKALCITCEPDELEQGLFGQAFYYVLQILPYLYEQSIFPAWELRTKNYGDPPDFVTIPGVLDLAYVPPSGPFHRLSLAELRRRHAHVIGNDWTALHSLWSAYFRTPGRVLEEADAIKFPGRTLGIHFRGTDKQTATWDTNPITQDQYLSLIAEFLRTRSDFNLIFAATDEFSFIARLRETFQLPVLTLGEVEFHMASTHTTTRAEKADRAMLDCVLLSRCAGVLETSSALPSFAKLLNPDLEIYRCAASKLFGKFYTKMPYFPVAQIPVLPAADARSQAILQTTMEDDWTRQPEVAVYKLPFVASPRWPLNHRVFRYAEKLGMDKLVGQILRGYR